MQTGNYIKITKELVDGEVVLKTETGTVEAVPEAKSAEERILELEAKLEALLNK